MNVRTRPENLSPSLGEDSIRLEESLIQGASVYDADGIKLILSRVLQLPPSGAGVISCIAELLMDMRICVENNSSIKEWVDALRQCKKHLEISQKITEPQDRLLISSIRTGPSRILLTQPSPRLSQEAKSQIRMIRASIILQHISQRQPISEKLSRIFAQMLTLKSNPTKTLAMTIRCNRDKLHEARNNYTPESEIAEFITSLISAIDEAPVSPPTLRAQQIAPIVSTKCKMDEEAENIDSLKSASDQNTDPSSENEADDSFKPTKEPIGEFLLETSHARPKDFSGIANLWDYLQPAELESACRIFISDLKGPNKNEALAALLTLFTRLRPSLYRTLPLSENKHSGMWLELSAGQICWQLEAAIDRKRWLNQKEAGLGREPVRIPLPTEILNSLREFSNCNPAGTNLGELLGGNWEPLEQSTRKYLKSISQTSHRVTLGRLRSSHARYLLSICGDEAYACVLGLDFRIGTPSNMNYVTLKASRINSIIRESYRRLEMGDIATPVKDDVGSRFIGKIYLVDKIISESLNNILSAWSHAKNRHDAASLAAAHTIISESTLRLMCIVTGHRESDCHSFATHTLDLELGLALIADKNVSPYHQTRLVPIPALAVKWIGFYFQWLRLIKYRYLRIDRNISKLTDSILNSRNERADEPLFFSLQADGKSKGLSNEDISEAFVSHGLEANAGRHWGDNILRDAGCDSAILMAWAGHSGIGQEAYGIRSALDPMSTCAAVRNAIDAHLAELCLPEPPTLEPRRCNVAFEHLHVFTPKGFAVDDQAAPVSAYYFEACPFHEFTLSKSRLFLHMCERWLSAAPLASIGTIAISLIIREGITNRPELIAGVNEVLRGRIFQDVGRYFIDTNTRELGIRRIWLDPITIRLVSTIIAIEPSAEEQLRSIQQAATDLINGIGMVCNGCSVDMALELARSFYSLRLPGIVRGWVFGEAHARTSRLETVARHAHNFVEHPSIERGRARQRSRTITSDDFIRTAILKACDKNKYGGTEQTRLNNLLDELSEFEHRELGDGLAEVFLKYALYLARKQESPITVARYYSGIRSFVIEHCGYLNSIDDFDEIEWEEPVYKFRDLKLAASEDGSGPELTALNNFLRCMDIDLVTLRCTDPARSARHYTDFPSLDEVRRTLELIPEISSLSKPRTEQALIAFETLTQLHLRWFEVSRLRAADTSPVDSACLAITHEAIGIHKTKNADRTLTRIDGRVATNLFALSQLRLSQFNSNEKAFLFADANSCSSVSEVTKLHNLVTDALWAATGSDFLHVHGGRRLVPIIKTLDLLDPELRRNISPLVLRQGLFSLSGDIGHGDPLTTIANYICGLDEVRRKWVDSIFSQLVVRASPNFLASLLGKPVDTLRARARRQSSLAQPNPLEGFDLSRHEILKPRIRPLHEYLVMNTSRLSIDPRESKCNEVLSCSIYVAAKILNTEESMAAFISQVSELNQRKLELGLKRIADAHGTSFHSRLRINPSSLLNSELFRSASNSLSKMDLNIGAALAISRAIQSPEKPWTIHKFAEVPAIKSLIENLDMSVFEVVVSRSKDKPGDINTFLTFPASKYRHRQLDSRLFAHGCKLKFQFIPRGITNEALPSKAPLVTFFISSVVISRCALSLGDNNE